MQFLSKWTLLFLLLPLLAGCASTHPSRNFTYSKEERAQEDAGDLLDQLPEDSEAWDVQNDRAVALLANESYPEAEAILQRLILSRPAASLPYLNLAGLYAGYAEWDWVRSVYKNMAANTGISHEELYRVADSLDQTARFTERAILLEELITYQRNPPEAILRLARDAAGFGFPELAVQYSREYLKTHPLHGETHHRLGLLLKDEPEVALAHLLLASELEGLSEDLCNLIPNAFSGLNPVSGLNPLLIQATAKGVSAGTSFSRNPKILILTLKKSASSDQDLITILQKANRSISVSGLSMVRNELDKARSTPSSTALEDLYRHALFLAKSCPREYRSLQLVRSMGELQLDLDYRANLDYLKAYLPLKNHSPDSEPFFTSSIYTAWNYETRVGDWESLMQFWYGTITPEIYGKAQIEESFRGLE